jgi:hypothetical protein
VLTACSLSSEPHSPTPGSAASTLASPAAAAAPLTVAWVENGDLLIWTGANPTPRRIASGGVIRPFLAPDGTQIAYLRGPEGQALSLWISDTPGSAERQLLAAAALADGEEVRRLSQIIWSPDSRTIYFNTQVGEGMNARPADDLWRIDAQRGVVERLLEDGSGGQIFPGPDASRIALVSAGEYGQPGASPGMPGRIAFYTTYTATAGGRTVALEYPAVATASEWRWYAQPRWAQDGSGVYVAIPPADLVYGAGATALWWVPVGGQPVRRGQVEADFFGLPTFSADGEWISFVQRRTTPDQTAITLMLAESDGAEPTVYLEGEVGSLTPANWLPHGNRFTVLYGGPGDLWIGQPGSPAAPFPADSVPVSDVIWTGANTYVVSSPTSDRFTLQTGALDAAAPLQTIATLGTYPIFDTAVPQALP